MPYKMQESLTQQKKYPKLLRIFHAVRLQMSLVQFNMPWPRLRQQRVISLANIRRRLVS